MDNDPINAPQDTAQQVAQAARLFDEHGGFIRVTLQHFIRDPAEQEELYQELFIYFVRKPVPDGIIRLRAWLYRVILDRIRDWKRRQSRYQNRLAAYAEKHPDRAGTSSPVPPDREQVEGVLEQIKRHLSKRQARAILYRYQYDLEVEEIARRMKVNPRTVTRYVSVGLKKLRMRLHKDAAQ